MPSSHAWKGQDGSGHQVLQGAHHFHKQGRPTVPLGSLPLRPTSLPRTFRPGFPTQAGLSYLQLSGKAEQTEGTQGFRLKLLFSYSKSAKTPTSLTTAQSPKWLWEGGEMFVFGFSSSILDCPRMSRGGQGSPGDIPVFIRYNLTASVSSGISRISTSASNTSMLEKLSGSKIFCERRKFT